MGNHYPNTGSILGINSGNPYAVPAAANGTGIPAVISRRPILPFIGTRNPHGGGRVPVIDMKIMACRMGSTYIKETCFNQLNGFQAIEIFGAYNPLYSGRPKALTQMLLNALSGYIRRKMGVDSCGLFYNVPYLAGVRAQRMRTSYAGLQLLEHWAEKYPKFAAFLAPYKSKKAVEQITKDCFDLANGVRPASFLKIDELNKIYEIKAENRKLKREAEQQKRYLAQMAINQSYPVLSPQGAIGQGMNPMYTGIPQHIVSKGTI